MKKSLLLLIACLQMQFLPGSENSKPAAADARFSLTALAGLRAFQNDEFEPVYHGSQPAFGLEIGRRLGRKIEVFFFADHLVADGELTHTKEATTLSLTALEGGARLALPLGRFVPYLGAGLGYYLVNEENVIGTLDEKQAGFFTLAGLRFRVVKSLFAEVRLKYVFLRLQPFSRSVDLGGFFAGGGIGVAF